MLRPDRTAAVVIRQRTVTIAVAAVVISRRSRATSSLHTKARIVVSVSLVLANLVTALQAEALARQVVAVVVSPVAVATLVAVVDAVPVSPKTLSFIKFKSRRQDNRRDFSLYWVHGVKRL